MRTIKSWGEIKRMKVGEAVRLHPSLKNPSVRVEDYRCPACHAFFMAPETPNFCPKCGARWNGKARAVAVGEEV